MRRYLIAPLIVGVLFAAGACGSKDETATTPTTVAAAKSSSDSTEKKSSTTEDDGGSSSDGDTGSGGAGDLPSGLDDNCIAISTLFVDIMGQSTAAMIPGGLSDQELEDLQDEIDEARSKADVPDEIKEPFAVWSDVWGEFADTMSGLEGGLTAANAAEISEAAEKVNAPEVTEAAQEIQTYVGENCVGGGLVEEP